MYKAKIKDICINIFTGGTPSKKHDEYYINGTIPWLNTSEINFNRIRMTKNFITNEGYHASSAKWVPENAVIIAMYGATAGKIALSKIQLTTNQACCNLIIDQSKADYRYVYYYLLHNYRKLVSLANGAAQQNLNTQLIKEFSIELPNLKIQEKIGNILSALDDKIELNNQINDNLAG